MSHLAAPSSGLALLLATLPLEPWRQFDARAEAGRALDADPTHALAREIIER